jgi:hypothetical protein
VEKCGIAGQVTDDNIGLIWRMRIACLTPKAKNTHSEYAIIDFPRQQCLQERAVMLQCYVNTYIHCLSCLLYTSTLAGCKMLVSGRKPLTY